MPKTILYTHVGLSTFVVKDLEILSSEYKLRIHHFSLKSKFTLPLSFIKQFFYLLLNAFSNQIWVIQFAGYQSFLPVLLGRVFQKKTVLVLGGTDCVSFPSIRYGCFYNPILRHFTRYSIKHASLLLPVDDTLVSYNYTYQENDFPKQGFSFHIPNVKTPFQVIYNGYDSSQWKTALKEENSFVTVAANLNTRFGKELKGIDLILNAAKLFPNCQFYIVGGRTLSLENSSNIHLLDTIPNDQLVSFIGSKQFYLQLSMSEGFPNALSEAMLCECIPIVSNVGAMPKIIGDTGYLLTKKNITELQRLIQQAIDEPEKSEKGKQARKQIKTNFSIQRRKSEFLAAMDKL
mgnify:CR=1 FL=1